MRVADVEAGRIFLVREWFGDDRNNMEVRETFYIRDPDDQCRYPHNVRVARLATIQGSTDDGSPPRYCGVLPEPCRDPGEMDGRVTCIVLEPDRPTFWSSWLKDAVTEMRGRA